MRNWGAVCGREAGEIEYGTGRGRVLTLLKLKVYKAYKGTKYISVNLPIAKQMIDVYNFASVPPFASSKYSPSSLTTFFADPMLF